MTPGETPRFASNGKRLALMDFALVKSIIEVAEVESTNDLARVLVAESPRETPFAIRALRQTKGRGRGANRWWSDEGSLTISFVFEPEKLGLSPAHESRLALIGALGLIETLADFQPVGRLGFRWPNDVEVGSKKIAGFLTERVETAFGRFAILGMGVNVTTRMDSAPESVRRMATSLVDVAQAGLPPEIENVLATFQERFQRYLLDLIRDRPNLPELWNAFDLLRDRPVKVAQGDHQVVEGIGAGIDPLGGLIVATDAGLQTLYGGSVIRDASP